MTRSSWARLVFGVTAAISLVTLGIELVYAAFGWYPGSEPDALTRVVNWFSYFTNFSNILCIVGLTMLAREPQRDGHWFRPVRLAGLVGITVTFFVYMVALRPDQVLDGIHIWTNAGYHVVVPALAVAGWLVFGPFPRADSRSLRSRSSGSHCGRRGRFCTAHCPAGTRTRSSTRRRWGTPRPCAPPP